MAEPFLQDALTLAREGLGRTSPNPAVGAILVRDGEVVGRGFHTWDNVKHAEVLAIEEAGERCRGATLYVTLEPCSHRGRTGACADAVVAAGVKRVVAAMQDPNPAVSGKGFERLSQAGIAVEIAEEHTRAAEQLNEAFIHSMRTGLPLVTLKAALTLDGKISAPEDNTGWITSERARAHVQQLRHHSDAILTGIGTVLADDCLLTDRSGLPRSRPLLRVVVDSTLRIPLTSKMVTSASGDLLLISTSAASRERRRNLEACGAKVELLDGPDGRVDLTRIPRLLARDQCRSLMIEAGSKVNWAALEANIADKIFFYYAPKILGGMLSLPVAGGAGRRRRVDAIRFHNVQTHAVAPDEFAVEAWVVR